jgi:ubiquinone/menaquinone biosynthesis C-methylase UbiE
MSVSSHLAIDLAEYDARIRTFIPDYEEMLDVTASTLRLIRRRVSTIVDLGTGTGALAVRLARARPAASVVGIDADEGMLATARRRLRRYAPTLIAGSFLHVPLPACDALTASFALHHVATRPARRALFGRAHAALRRGGVLVSADCHPGSAVEVVRAERLAWRSHLARTYGPRQADAYLRAWAAEDFYVPLDDERRLLQAAGFETDIVWRRGSFAVIAAWRR